MPHNYDSDWDWQDSQLPKPDEDIEPEVYYD